MALIVYALRAVGWRLEHIAELFGVSRRVLRDAVFGKIFPKTTEL